MKITLATKITIFRILMIIPAAAMFIAAHYCTDAAYTGLIIASAVLFALLCISDFIDGAVARKTNTVTDLGKFLDPVADKIVIAVMLFLIVEFGGGLSLGGDFAANSVVIAVLAGLIMARELVICILRTVAAKKGRVLASDMLGKIKTWFMNISVTALMLAGLHVAVAYIGTLIFYMATLLTLVSGVNYIIKNLDVLEESGADNGEDSGSVAGPDTGAGEGNA